MTKQKVQKCSKHANSIHTPSPFLQSNCIIILLEQMLEEENRPVADKEQSHVLPNMPITMSREKEDDRFFYLVRVIIHHTLLADY